MNPCPASTIELVFLGCAPQTGLVCIELVYPIGVAGAKPPWQVRTRTAADRPDDARTVRVDPHRALRFRAIAEKPGAATVPAFAEVRGRCTARCFWEASTSK